MIRASSLRLLFSLVYHNHRDLAISLPIIALIVRRIFTCQNWPATLEELDTLFRAWLSECYHSKLHSALGTTPEIAFKGDSMPPHFVDTALLSRAFLHCEQRKAYKSG